MWTKKPQQLQKICTVKDIIYLEREQQYDLA